MGDLLELEYTRKQRTIKNENAEMTRKKDGGWKVFDGGTIEVIPLMDSKSHKRGNSGIGCGCKPILEKGKDGRLIVVHNSFDGRKSNNIEPTKMYD